LHHRFLGIVEATGAAAWGSAEQISFAKEFMRHAMTGLSHN
jgi:hypothetical protein